MLMNGLLVLLFIICIVFVLYQVKKKMNKANCMLSKRNEASSLIVNCNDYRPIGDVFASLNNLLEDNKDIDHIQYKGHF